MGETIKTDQTVREYLLGQVSDEAKLGEIEDMLFTDDEFCSRVELEEDGLINDYVLGRLDAGDAESFRATLAANPERRLKLDTTRLLREKALGRTLKARQDRPSILAPIKVFLRRPAYAAALALLLVAAAAVALYFSRSDQLAELRSIYARGRPIEPRISEFDYAPIAQLRGERPPEEQDRLRQIENSLIGAKRADPSAKTHHALGVVYLAQQDYENAIRELKSALTFDDAAFYYQSSSQWWREMGRLADLSLKLGLPSTSLSLSTERLRVVSEIEHAPQQVNDSLRSMILAAEAKKDFAAALKYADDSIRNAPGAEDTPENTRIKGDIHRLIADVKSQAKDYSDALTHYDRALDMYRRIPEMTFALYQIHKGRLFCFQQLNDDAGFAEVMETVMRLSEEYRKTIREDRSRQAFFANQRDVFDAAIESAIRRRDTRRAFELAEASRARSLLEFVQSDKSMAEVEADFASVVRPLSLDEIQSRMPEQVLLVQYAVLPERLAIWVLSRSRFDFIEKRIAADELEKRIERHQDSIIRGWPAAEVSRTGRELYDLLIPPDLGSEGQLCLVPDKVLHQLAYAALATRQGRYLLEDHALFYAPSASVFVLATENARRREQSGNERLLSVGNPDFDREENPRLPDLRAAEIEATSIVGEYSRSRRLLGGEATKEEFLKDFSEAEVIHFAGHFLANRRSPANSKLLFAGGELRSSELAKYKLPNAKLVVLSACQTGFERYDRSEGAIGAARTFLALGAPVVIASQWQVDSEAAKDLMIAFHRNRKEKGAASAESLRQAQIEALNAERTNAPFYWAAFSLYGGYADY